MSKSNETQWFLTVNILSWGQDNLSSALELLKDYTANMVARDENAEITASVHYQVPTGYDNGERPSTESMDPRPRSEARTKRNGVTAGKADAPDHHSP